MLLVFYDMVLLFSVAAFFVVLREVLEACLIVGVMLAYLNRVGSTQYKRWVWIGTILGLFISLIIGLTVGILFYVSGHHWFERIETVFEGLIFLISSFFLTAMLIWMLVMSHELRARVEGHLDNVIDREDQSNFRKKISLLIIAFLQIFREGVECVLFLIGAASADSVGGWRSIPIPAVIAIILALAMVFLVFKGLIKLNIIRVLQLSSTVTVFLAAGLFSHGFHELQKSKWFGVWEPEAERPWWNANMWSLKECCDDESNEFFAMLRSVVGYQDNPSFLEFITFFSYWFVVIFVFIMIYWTYIRAFRTKTLQVCHHLILWSLLITFVGFIYSLLNVTWIGLTSMTIGLCLSIISFIVFFEAPLHLLKMLVPVRRILGLLCAVSWTSYTIFIFSLHVVVIACEGKEKTCLLDKFYFFGLILSKEFNEVGRKPHSWPGIAVLAFSIVISTFFFTAMSVVLGLAGLNINEDGEYIDDEAILVSEGDSLDPIKVGELPGV